MKVLCVEDGTSLPQLDSSRAKKVLNLSHRLKERRAQLDQGLKVLPSSVNYVHLFISIFAARFKSVSISNCV